MATYSNAPGITTSAKLTTPSQSDTGSSSDSFTVPANSYAKISVFCSRGITLLSSAGAANQSVPPGTSMVGNPGLILSNAIVAAGETVSVTRSVHVGLGTNTVTVSVGGTTILSLGSAASDSASVHYVVFS